MVISSTNLSSISSSLRIGGLASGLDTDSIVKKLMQAERIPLDKLKQSQQKLEWKRDRYRDTTNTLRGFNDDFFNVLNTSSNMLSTSAYKKLAVTSDNPSVVTATAVSSAATGVHAITNITSLAAAANVTGTAVSAPLVGSAAPASDFTNANTFNISLNGVTKSITLRNGAYATNADLISNVGNDGIQDLVNQAFGAGKITVTDTGAGLKFDAPNSTIVLTSGASNDALAKLNISNGFSNRINLSDTLQNLQTRFANNITFGGATNDQIQFTINGTQFNFKNTDTLNTIMTTVNSSQAGVNMSYSSLTDSFSITSKQKGSGNNIVISNGLGNFFGINSASNIAASSFNNGTDAVFTLDGTANVTRNDNNFTIDGVNYSLKSTYNIATPININLTQDVDSIYNNIKAFVDRYNNVISNINSTVAEKYDKNYPPLTDDQKSAMNATDIQKWEDKAKIGLLQNDPLLEKTVNDMRTAIYSAINGVSGNITDIGISTGNYTDKGKLIIDETKLRNAIQTDPDKVMNSFSQKSTIDYSPNLSAADRKTRYDNEGIAYRLSDILQDNIRTSVNSFGKEGILLDKAGITGDVSQYTNSMDKDINAKTNAIYDLNNRLNKKEQAYYKKFSAMETALSKMNSQSSWLTQQLGGTQSGGGA